jgi:preprotein translocase subunit YajC
MPAGGSGTSQFIGTAIWLVMLSGLMYLMVIRPQQQQQKKRIQMMAQLKSGDKVVTAGGLVGTITRIQEESVTIRIADRVEVELMKTGIAYVPEN